MFLLVACTPKDALVVHAPEELEPALTDFVEFLPFSEAELRLDEDTTRAVDLIVKTDLDCVECYELEPLEEGDLLVHAGDALGAQYGLAHALELGGFRFHHPYDPQGPESFELPASSEVYGARQEPEMVRRGLHLHTLHPIEGLYDFWMPGEPEAELRARQVLDFVVKNRGNHLQWVGLEDIESPSAHAAWAEHTASILDAAHARGVSCGVGIQLFGASNLQLALDLIDEPEGDLRAQLEQRWALVTALPFDVYNLSFGEFSDFEPDFFIETIDLAFEVLQEQAPEAEMTTLIHVGDDLRVEYEGEETIYYLLAQHADPDITPWVHTVMYFNLFEDAQGAYHHEEFDLHRAYILEKLDAGEPVAYFPESAYWIAMDDSVPTYLPVYIRSRWLDMVELRDRAATPLLDHTLFSTGWEWGYWQNDVMTLRMNWALPEDYGSLLVDLLGEEHGQVVYEAAELQHGLLIEGPLAAWLSSRDAAMEVGYGLDILSQPRRPDVDEWSEDPGIGEVLEALDRSEVEHAALAARLSPEDRWTEETRDGLEIDALRSAYMADLVRAVIETGDFAPAEAHLDEARVVIDRRHGALHDPQPQRLIEHGDNPTLYDYGYLLRAEQLCFWERERIQARNHVLGEGETVPACLFE
jgi:hypothetical protein